MTWPADERARGRGAMDIPRTPAKKKARELAKHLRGERPD